MNRSDLETVRRARRVGYGLYLVVAGVLAGALSALASVLLGGMLSKLDAPDPTAAWLLERPWIFVVAALPAIAIGVLVLRRGRRTLPAVFAGSAMLVVPIILVMYCFLSLIAPLYQMQEL